MKINCTNPQVVSKEKTLILDGFLPKIKGEKTITVLQWHNQQRPSIVSVMGCFKRSQKEPVRASEAALKA